MGDDVFHGLGQGIYMYISCGAAVGSRLTATVSEPFLPREKEEVLHFHVADFGAVGES